MKRQRIKYKNKQVSTYKKLLHNPNDMAGDKSRDIYPCFHNGPLWVCKKEMRKK